ncbi:GyrI-like domain-containing protein [Enterococcus sp. LJL90]
MNQISKIYVKELPELIFLSHRQTIDFFAEYSGLIGETLPKIDEALEKENLAPSSGLVTCFHNIDLAQLDVEVGMVIPRRIATKKPLNCTVLPAGLVATTIDLGEYEKQDPTMMALSEWIPKNGYQANGGIYYHYLNDEKQPPENYLTQMLIPIVKVTENFN